MYTKENFLHRLKTVRKRKSWTLPRLNRELKMPRGRLSKIEKGETEMTVNEFLNVCQILGVTPKEFFDMQYTCGEIDRRKVYEQIEQLNPQDFTILRFFIRSFAKRDGR